VCVEGSVHFPVVALKFTTGMYGEISSSIYAKRQISRDGLNEVFGAGMCRYLAGGTVISAFY